MGAGRKRLITLVVTVLVLSTLLSIPAGAVDFSDTKNHWARVPIGRWTDYGVLDGYAGMVFRPDTPIKRAELFKMVCVVMNYQDKAENPFSDLNTGSWYYDYIVKLVGAGVLNGSGGQVNPDKNITREEAFALLSRVFKVQAFDEGINSFSDASDVSYWARGEAGGMIRAGYVKGDAGKIRPKSHISRGEAVQLFDNIVRGYVFESETYSSNIEGVTVVNTGGVTFRDMVVNGDLYITQGIDSKTVTLDNVVVNGDLHITGGGSGGGSVLLRGNTRANRVYISSTATPTQTMSADAELMSVSPLRVSISSPAEVQSISVEDGSKPVTIEGTAEYVEVGSDATAIFSNATIGQVNMNSEFARIRVNESARINKLLCNAPRCDVYGNGTVELTYVYDLAKGTKIDTGKNAIMTEIQSWTDDLLVSGIGNISFLYVNEGKNARVTVGGTIVIVGKDADTVITGDGPNDFIKPGDTGQVGKPGLENALNVIGVTVTGANTIEVQFSKAPDPLKGASPKNYSLSGDARRLTVNETPYPDFVEISGNKAILTFSNARFSALLTGQTAIVTVSGFSAADSSPIGVDSGIYRVPSDDATLKSGTLANEAINGIWTGGAIGDGGSPLVVTIPRRLAANATLALNKGESQATIKLYITSKTGAAPTSEAQYTQTKLTGLNLNDGDRIYIEVTAPNGVTKKYYKLTVTVISAPTLDSITYEVDEVRLNFSNLDTENRMRITSPTDDQDISDEGHWARINKTTTDGTGYVAFSLKDKKACAMITEELAQGYALYVGTHDGGSRVEQIKNLGTFGLKSTVGEIILKDRESVYYTVDEGLRIHGLSPLKPYIAEVSKSAGGDPLRSVHVSDRDGVLDLGSQTGVTKVVLQQINDTQIEVRYSLGAPIEDLVGFRLLMTENKFTVSSPINTGKYGIYIGANTQLMGKDYNGETLVTPSGNTYTFTSLGLQKLTELSSGNHRLTVREPGVSVIATKLGDLTVNDNLQGISGKFSSAKEILFSGGRLSTGNVFLCDIAASGAGNTAIKPSTLNSSSDNNKVKLNTDFSITYDDGAFNRGYAYLVTASSISKPARVGRWIYDYYPFNGTYTIDTSTSFSTANRVLRGIRNDVPGVNHKVIEVDGELYRAPTQDTFIEILTNLVRNDTFTVDGLGKLTNITGKSGGSLNLTAADCSSSGLTVSGSDNSSNYLSLTSAGFSSRLYVNSGHVETTGLGSCTVDINGPAIVKAGTENRIEVRASNVTIVPSAANSQTGKIRINGPSSSATLLGVTLSGDGSTMWTVQNGNEYYVNIADSVFAQASVATNSYITTVNLDPICTSARITSAKPELTVDISNMSFGTPTFITSGARKIHFKLSGSCTGAEYLNPEPGDPPYSSPDAIGLNRNLQITTTLGSQTKRYVFNVTGVNDNSTQYSTYSDTFTVVGVNGTNYNLRIS